MHIDRIIGQGFRLLPFIFVPKNSEKKVIKNDFSM